MRSPDFIRDRSRALRRRMTEPERVLWLMLRSDLMGLHFRRQHPVGPYILDFCCAAAKLCIEIDGPPHYGEEPRDARRTTRLAGER